MSDAPKSRLDWKNFAIAAAMLPIGFLMWVWGMDAIGARTPNLFQGLCLLASPFVMAFGGLWMLVLVVGRLWPSKHAASKNSEPPAAPN
jgi:hypothetical protein